jgi:4-alpha-glucanotransferase
VNEAERALVTEALRRLDKQRLVLSIQDPSFPAEPDEDIGRGTPYGRGARRFFSFVRELGFDGVLLGPQGEVSPDHPSPYDGTAFSRCTASIALAPLVYDPAWGHLLHGGTLATLVESRPRAPAGRAHHRYAHAAARRALDEAWAAFSAARGSSSMAGLAARFDDFRAQNDAWLAPEARWCGESIEAFAFRQFVAHAQHAALRESLHAEGLALHGDLAIGLAAPDVAANTGLFLADYRMGAPPSRTNPEGQPWSYPVFDPAQWSSGVRAFLQRRIDKLFAEYDGLRIDHPHGLVDPWVYAAHAPDPLVAVQRGARLRSSPDLPDHPALSAWSIVRAEQLDRRLPRHADGWVARLEPAQIDRYSVLFDAIVASARRHGRSAQELFCEVLSTLPAPVAAVLARHGLGRFRVLQKADTEKPDDVYRSEHAAPEDWVMMGTHDTPPIWQVVETWQQRGAIEARARYLAERLSPGDVERFAAALAADSRLLVHAVLADGLASRARSVLIFWTDLFGRRETYNVPGTISDDNWTLRLTEGWAQDYGEKRAHGEALDLRLSLSLALRARAGGESGDMAALAEQLSPLPAGA